MNQKSVEASQHHFRHHLRAGAAAIAATTLITLTAMPAVSQSQTDLARAYQTIASKTFVDLTHSFGPVHRSGPGSARRDSRRRPIRRSFANPDAESSRVLVILFGCFFERLNSRVDARHLSINISEPASPPTISISHSAVRSDSNLPSFRPHSRRRFTTFAIIAARTSVMTSAIVANKLSKSCHAQVTPI